MAWGPISVGGSVSGYTLPTATASVLGGVKTGSNITNSGGTISITKVNVTEALGYTPPTANTWRGIQDNLTSTATDQSLSANQGKVLKGLVDGKAASSHTHDDRYYTESEMNTKLNGKANASHCREIGLRKRTERWMYELSRRTAGSRWTKILRYRAKNRTYQDT